MSAVKILYHFSKEGEDWIVHNSTLCQDYKLTKENLKKYFYDAFEKLLPVDDRDGLERAKAKLPAFIQIPGQILPTDVGAIETTIELYVRRHQIEQVHIIFTGTNGTTAKVPVEKFQLALEYLPNLEAALPDE